MRCVPLVSAASCPPAKKRLAEQVYCSALAEMGFDVSVEDYHHGGNAKFTPVPWDLHHKAREVAYRSAGIPFQWRDDDADASPLGGLSRERR